MKQVNILVDLRMSLLKNKPLHKTHSMVLRLVPLNAEQKYNPPSDLFFFMKKKHEISLLLLGNQGSDSKGSQFSKLSEF